MPVSHLQFEWMCRCEGLLQSGECVSWSCVIVLRHAVQNTVFIRIQLEQRIEKLTHLADMHGLDGLAVSVFAKIKKQTGGLDFGLRSAPAAASWTNGLHNPLCRTIAYYGQSSLELLSVSDG